MKKLQQSNKKQNNQVGFLSRESKFSDINKRADLTYNWIKDIQPKVLSAPSVDPRNRDYYNWIIGKPSKKMVFEKQKTYIPKSLSLEEKLNIPTYDKNQYHYKRPVNPYIGLLPSKPVYKSNVQLNYGYYPKKNGNPTRNGNFYNIPSTRGKNQRSNSNLRNNYMYYPKKTGNFYNNVQLNYGYYPTKNGNFYNIPSTIGKNQRSNSTWRNHNGYSFGHSGRFDVKQAISSGNVARMLEKNFTANSKYTNQPSWGYHKLLKPNSYYNRRNQYLYYSCPDVIDNQCNTALSTYKKPKAVWR